MVDLVLRKTGNKNPHKEYALMVRDYSSGVEVDWTTLCYLDYYSAQQLNNKTVGFWNSDPEDIPEVRSLRLQNQNLREAWDNYQTLKSLIFSK